MPVHPTLAKKALITGEYYLIEVDEVLEFYKAAGFDVEDEDEDVPTVLTIEGKECFFTGDHIQRGEKYYELVVVAKDFSWDEVEGEDDDEE